MLHIYRNKKRIKIPNQQEFYKHSQPQKDGERERERKRVRINFETHIIEKTYGSSSSINKNRPKSD